MTIATERLTVALADRYRILRHLGAGGMATVYLAEDLKHDRKVAIKVLKPDLAAVLGAERFVVEIKTTAALQHPHILPLFDSGTADGFLFYVMPYIEGETLRDKLNRESQLAVDEALRITSEVADALDYAHRHGVIHRDIKPENILLHDGRPIVADFGIALAVSAAAGGRMTETGLSLGTPHYMSPEQATADKEISARSDVYSLASVCYEMLAGQPPHIGGTAQQIIMRIITDQARPVTELRKSVPPHVAATLARALEKLPADRFASAKEFREALSNPSLSTLQGTSAMWAPNGATQRLSGGVSGRAFAAALAVAIIASVAAIVSWTRNGGASAAAIPSLEVKLAGALANESSVVGVAMAISDDGRLLAVSVPDSLAQSRLVIRDLSKGTEVSIEPDALATSFSPDGRLLAYAVPGSSNLRVVSAEGGLPRAGATLATPARGVTWIDDTTLILGGLRRVTLGRSDVDSLPRPAGDTRVILWPHRVTNHLILISAGDNGELANVGVYDVRNATFRSLGVRGQYARYVDPGIVLYLDEGSVWGLEVDPSRLTPRGSPRVVVDGRIGGQVLSYSASRNGVLAVRRGGSASNRRLVITDRRGTERDIKAERGQYRSVRFSPDGERIAHTNALRATFGSDIFVTSIRDGSTTRVTSDSMYLAPEWSPDGRRVVFASNRTGGATQSFVISADAAGGGAFDTLLARTNRIYEHEITPDGKRILWREDVAVNARDILSAELSSKSVRPERATRFDERGIALSPDGEWYLYTSTETGRSEVYLSRLGGDGARWRVSPSGGAEPRWARNGEIFYRTLESIYVTRATLNANPQVAPPRLLFADPYYYIGFEAIWDVSADGQQFAFVALDQSALAYVDLMVNWIPRWRANAR